MTSFGKRYGAVVTLIEDVYGGDFSKLNAALVEHSAAFVADNRDFKYQIDNERGILKIQVTSLTDFPDFKEKVEALLSKAGLTGDAIETTYSIPPKGLSR